MSEERLLQMDEKLDRLLETTARVDERTQHLSTTVNDHSKAIGELRTRVDFQAGALKVLGTTALATLPVLLGLVVNTIWG